jgi:ATP adenylyltransferase
MAWLREAGAAPAGDASCLFCDLAREGASPETLVLETYATCFLMLNAFPYTSGHAMVAPYRHHDSLLGDAGERAEMQAALERVRRALILEYAPDGFNVGANLGRAAGAGIPGHVHWHIVPRWQGDTNFVPVVAATRVLPEALPDTYARVLGALAGVDPDGLTVTGRGHGP